MMDGDIDEGFGELLCMVVGRVHGGVILGHGARSVAYVHVVGAQSIMWYLLSVKSVA